MSDLALGTVRTKICGLTQPEDVDAVVAAGADAIGVVVDVPVATPREIEADHARALLERVPPYVTTVLVTFPSAVTELLEATDPDVVQLHGEVTPDRIEMIRSRTGTAVVKTIPAGAMEAAERYAPVADALHVDSTDEAGGGGTGRTHDWTGTRDIVDQFAVPVVLAGGLTPENVGEAIRTVRPFAVDVASGVESDGGVKDHDAVHSFIRESASAMGDES